MEFKNKVLDSAEVFLHNDEKDCWVIINARVYDVTNFLNDHPGGDGVLLAVAGKDASEEFEEAGHGSAARLMLDEYYVGEVEHVTPFSGISKTTIAKPKIHFKQQTVMKEDKQSGSNVMVKSLGILLPIAIIGVAIGFALYN